MSKREWMSGSLLGIVLGLVAHRFKDKPKQVRHEYRSKKEQLLLEGKQQYEIIQSSKERLAVTAEKTVTERGNHNE